MSHESPLDRFPLTDEPALSSRHPRPHIDLCAMPIPLSRCSRVWRRLYALSRLAGAAAVSVLQHHQFTSIRKPAEGGVGDKGMLHVLK